MKVKKNDTVLVISGKDAGKTGVVLAAMPKTNKVIVQGVNIQKKHQKARNANETSQIISKEGAIDVSNVEIVCPVCGKATRVKYGEVNGKKVRVCKCGANLDEKKAAPKKEKKAAKKVEDVEEVVAEEKPAKKTTAKKSTATAEKKPAAKKTKKAADEGENA